MRIKDLVPWAHRRGDAAPEEERNHPVESLQREMNRVFDEFWQRLERPFGRHQAVSDVVEAEDAVEVSVELPGMDRDDIELTIAGDGLVVRGEKQVERQDEKRGYYISERTYGSVYRHLPLPSGVDIDKAEASFRNGVLTVRLPRTEEAKGRQKQIPIKED